MRPPNPHGATSLAVYIHTNRTLLPTRLGFKLVTGWWADGRDNGTEHRAAAQRRVARAARLRILRERWGAVSKPKWMVEHSFKWEWLIERARHVQQPRSEPILLVSLCVIEPAVSSHAYV